MLPFFLAIPVSGQSLDDLLGRLSLNQALYPPQSILSTKSIVLLSVPEDSQVSEWQEITDELQQFFAKVGVDAIVWFDSRLYQIQQNETIPIAKTIGEREPTNLILFEVKNEESPVFMAIGPYNGQPSFWNKGDAFWARQSVNLEGIINELTLLFRTDQFPRTNLLVNETTEFFDPEFSVGLIAKSIPPAIKEFKTYLDMFELDYHDQLGFPAFTYEAFEDKNELMQQLREFNYKVEAITNDSTTGIAIRDRSKTIQQLRREGFQYALKYIKAPESLLYEWIPFENRPAARDQMVYKFFLDDLRNNNNYVGSRWDADPNWNTALENFLSQIRLIREAETND